MGLAACLIRLSLSEIEDGKFNDYQNKKQQTKCKFPHEVSPLTRFQLRLIGFNRPAIETPLSYLG